ncbi:MAG: SDR family oxidoreductase [Rhizobiaceae bacterium]|nr:SDR family oxidoreductase [Rhizobiaceae bacterium]
MLTMAGKVAMVTGAARGIGAAQASLIARQGGAVVLCDVLEREGNDVADRIRQDGGEAIFCRLDVSDEAQWASVLAQTIAWKGKVTTLVNNAAVLNRTGVTGTRRADWDRVISINLTGPFLGMQAVAPAIRDAGGGAVVNVSSICAHVGHNDAAYTSSKAGMLGLTRTAAVEYVDWNIRVNAVCPGIIVTEANAGAPHLQPWLRATPLRRYGTTQEVANLVLFLVSDEAGFITGEDILVDGGFKSGGAARRISLEMGLDLTAPPK